MSAPIPDPADDRLARLFAGLYGSQPASTVLIADAQVASALLAADPLAEDPVVAVQRAFPGQSLSVRQLGVIRLARELLRDYFAQPVYHPDLGQALMRASGSLIAEALPVNGWLLRPQHPVHALLALIERMATGWHPGLPQASETVSLLSGWLNQPAPADERLVSAEQGLQEHQQRQERITARVAESEFGVLRLNYIRQTSARSLNRLLAGRSVPDFMAESIARHWAGAFQWTLLHQGEQSPLWQKLVRGFGLLVWSVQPEAADASQRSKLTRVIDQIKSELMPLLDEVIADEGLRQQLREQVDIAHLSQLHARPMEHQPVPAITGGNALDDAGAGVSQDLLSEVAAIHVGDWFSEPATGRRLRLLLKLDQYQQLLFVNQLGMKQVSASFEAFAWQFSSAQISALVAPVPLREWSAERLATLADQYRQRQRSREQEHRARQEAVMEEAAAREKARNKALAEARQLTATRQQQVTEGEVLKQVEVEVELELARRESIAAGHGASEAQRRQRARLLVSGLSMGMWLTFHDDKGEQTRRKLAVVLPSSGKYIFVDRLGTDKYEVLRDDLIAGIAAGAVDVVRKDSRFDDALTRVVDGIRQDRGWGDG
jgi:hypothetical protein